jgi:hypothetical protein
MELNLERLRLVIQFDDEGKASYPLEIGAYSFGSNKNCTIRLQGPEIEDVHAILSIDQGCICMENCASSNPLSKSGVPIQGKVYLGVGDVVALGPYQLSLIELAPPRDTATHNLSLEAREEVEELWRQMRRGLPGYDNILAKLVAVISPEEANAARTATLASLKAFGLTIGALTLLTAGAAVLPATQPNVAVILYDLAKAGFLVGSLLMISRLQVNFAGRVMMPLLWCLKFFKPPTSDWYELPHFSMVLFDLTLAFIVGALLDFGASSEPGRGYRNFRRGALLAVGALAIYDAVYESKTLQGWTFLLSIGAGLSCILWSWWPGPSIEQSCSLKSFDAQILKLIGTRRWFRFAGGRFLAICLGLFPGLLFLHSFQMGERLKWPETNSPDAAIQTSEAEPRIFFWKQTAHLLQPADLQNYELYGFRHQELPPILLKNIQDDEAALANNPHDGPTYNNLKRHLLPYRLSTPQKVLRLLSDAKLYPGSQSLYYLEENRLKPTGLFGSPDVLFSARNQISPDFNQFASYTSKEIKSREVNSKLRRFVLVVCGFIGLLILWKRGGDWGFALWLGLWFMGVGTLGTYRYNLFFFPVITYDIWHKGLTSPTANFLLRILQVLDSLVLLNIIIFSAFIACAAVWIWACWPTEHANWRPFSSRRLQALKIPYTIVFTWKTFLVSLLMNLLFWGTWVALYFLLLRSKWDVNLAPILASLIFVSCAFAVGIKLRKRARRRLKSLDWGSGLLFLSTQVLALLSAPELPNLSILSIQSTTLKMLGYTLICALVFIFLIQVVRQNFLRLFTIRDASIVITASIALILLKVTEDLIEMAIAYFGKTTGIPEGGARALGLSAFVLLCHTSIDGSNECCFTYHWQSLT